MTRKALGKGLSALLKDQESTAEPDQRELDVDLLEPNRFQPRQVFSEPRLEELAQSIRTHGFIQPIVVRRAGDRYQIIAGERRWRAAQRLGLSRVPVAVKSISDVDLLEVSLIENIQRENLNPMEEAAGLQRLADEFRMTHEQVADAVGRSRSATTNLLRLLRLTKPVQAMVMEGVLEMGHARALLSLEGARQIEAANRIAARGLSVREAEALAGHLQKGPAARRKPRVDRDLARLEEEVSSRLGTTVEIRAGPKGSGKIVVHYSGLEHLDQLLKKLR